MKFRRLLLAVTALAVPAASIAQTVVRTDDRAPGRPGRVAVTTADGNIAQVEAVVPIRADGTVIDPAGGGGGSSAVAQGSTTAGQSGGLTQAAVVSGDQAYTVGTTQPLTLTSTGRLKVGLSSHAPLPPGPMPATTTTADIVGCQYRASPVTWSDMWTGSMRCDSNGRLATVLEQPLPAGTNALGSVIAGGTVADGVAQTGNPVPIGGAFVTTLPAYSAGQRVQAQFTSRGLLYTAIGGTSGLQAQVAGASLVDATASTNGMYVVGQGLVFNGATWDRMRGDTTGQYVVAKGTATLTSGQVSVGTTATQIVAAQAGRGRLTITVDAAVKCYIGPSGVTTTTGYPLQATAGATHTMNTAAPVFMVCGQAATPIGYIVES